MNGKRAAYIFIQVKVGRMTVPATNTQRSLIMGLVLNNVSKFAVYASSILVLSAMKLRNILLVLKDQMPLDRFIRNLRNGGVLRKFKKRSHLTRDNKPKVMYNTQASAQKAAEKMGEKNGRRFSFYKCAFCDGYHIGGN